MEKMNTSNDTWTLCEQSKLLVNTKPLYTIHVFQFLFGSIGFLNNLIAIYFLLKVKAFHSNLRILLGNFSFSLSWYSLSIALKGFRRLITPVCDLPVNLRPCLLDDLMIGIPLHNSVLSLLAVCMERLYSTFRYRTYDKNGRPYLGIFLLLSTWAGTLYNDLRGLSNLPENIFLPICDLAIFFDPTSVGTMFAGFVCLEIVSFTSTILVYISNRFILKRMVINRAKFDLSARFQVDQNLNLSSALLPSDLLHIICYLPSYAFLTSMLLLTVSMKLPTREWFLHLTYLYRVFFALGHPLILITRNQTIRQRVVKTQMGIYIVRLFKCCSNEDTRKINDMGMTAMVTANAHFDQLEQVWMTALSKRQRITVE